MSKNELSRVGFQSIIDQIPENCYLRLHGSYRFSVYPGWKATREMNDDLHIFFAIDGEGCYHIQDGPDIPLKKGKMVFISHGVLHHATINLEKPLFFTGLRFGIYNYAGCDVTREIAHRFHYAFPAKNFVVYDDLMWKIHQLDHKKNDQISQKFSSLLLYQLIHEFYQSTSDDYSHHVVDARLEKARRFIEDHVHKKISVTLLASHVGMSTRYLQKCFKKAYLFSPKEYHQNMQMNVAYTLLTHDCHSVTQTAEKLNYADVFAFSKQFKKHFGYSPSEVRGKRL